MIIHVLKKLMIFIEHLCFRLFLERVRCTRRGNLLREFAKDFVKDNSDAFTVRSRALQGGRGRAKVRRQEVSSRRKIGGLPKGVFEGEGLAGEGLAGGSLAGGGGWPGAPGTPSTFGDFGWLRSESPESPGSAREPHFA